MFRSVSEFIQSTQFIGQPGKPIQSAIKYHSFLYIALNEDNKPKIGFSIGDRILGKEYTFVWSWSLPKPIAIESKIKQQLNPFAIKSETIEFDDLKYKTETFNIDVLTLIHIATQSYTCPHIHPYPQDAPNNTSLGSMPVSLYGHMEAIIW